MVRNLIVFDDGRRIFSGEPGCAIESLTLQQAVSDTQELEPGAVCAAMVEFSVLDAPGMTVQAGQEFTLYKVSADGTTTRQGVFIAQKPVRSTPNAFTVTAYDRVTLLDKDLGDWFSALQDWPYSLWQLAQMVCSQCGVPLKEQNLPLGALPVEKFTVSNIKGRQLLRYIAQALGTFVRADRQGNVEFAWYTPAPVTIGPVTQALTGDYENQQLTLHGVTCQQQGDTLHITGAPGAVFHHGCLYLTGQTGYRQGSLELADYACEPVQRVCIRENIRDAGLSYPKTTGDKNTYCITGNPLLQAMGEDYRRQIAGALYEKLRSVSYVPCTVELPVMAQLEVGQFVHLVSPLGKTVTVYLMQRHQSRGIDRFTATGSSRRDSTMAVNNESYALQNRVMELQADIHGLRAENRQGQEKAAAVAVTVEGITAQVEQQIRQQDFLTQELTQVRQDARQLQLQVQRLEGQGAQQVTTTTGYTFGAQGLRIAKSGQEMENLLDDTGMCVSRCGSVILRATAQGVTAQRVAVGDFLAIGDHARLEDFSRKGQSRTGCFYM